MEKKTWHRPQVTETETGMEVTSYMPADVDVDVL